MSLLSDLQGRRVEMVDALQALVEAESPSSDAAACTACAVVADKIGVDLLGESAEHVLVGGNTHLRWRFGSATKVVLIGHLDTVWPLGTIDRWPFSVDGDKATGPGSFDMKAGVVQGLFALSAVDDLDGVAVLLTTDEEIGSPTARPVIEELVGGAEAVLVLEPSAGGALKTQRKGVAYYRVEITGRAAHAGLDPEKGINAAVEAAHQILKIGELADPNAETTVTPSVVTAGSTSNTVPGRARVDVDVRALTVAELERVHEGMSSLTPVLPGAEVLAGRHAGVTPLEHAMSADLYAIAKEVAGEIGLPVPDEATVGGGSDGNFTAGLGIPTLDGLGPVGDGAHAEGEWVSIEAMPERAALVAGLVQRLK